MGVVYVECKVCCKFKCKCFKRCEMDYEMDYEKDYSDRGKRSCGCSAGASRYYRYND